jgi:membrane associated rhomboid family serine protease
MMNLRLTKAVKAILIACIAMFLLEKTVDQFLDGNLLGWFGLIPSGVVMQHRWWQLITYAFLHADVTHLFLNMLMLVFIASEIEAAWGTVRFLRYYFFCSISAGLLYLVLQMFVWGGQGLHTPMVGASGAIYGLLLAYGLMFGERVLLFMMLFPMKAKHFVWILGAVEFFTTVYSGRNGLSGAAHLGGMMAGLAYLWVKALYQSRKRQSSGKGPSRLKKFRKNKGHLKLIIDNEQEINQLMHDDDHEGGPKTWN